jgi:hypothetical protein
MSPCEKPTNEQSVQRAHPPADPSWGRRQDLLELGPATVCAHGTRTAHTGAVRVCCDVSDAPAPSRINQRERPRPTTHHPPVMTLTANGLAVTVAERRNLLRAIVDVLPPRWWLYYQPAVATTTTTPKSSRAVDTTDRCHQQAHWRHAWAIEQRALQTALAAPTTRWPAYLHHLQARWPRRLVAAAPSAATGSDDDDDDPVGRVMRECSTSAPAPPHYRRRRLRLRQQRYRVTAACAAGGAFDRQQTTTTAPARGRRRQQEPPRTEPVAVWVRRIECWLQPWTDSAPDLHDTVRRWSRQLVTAAATQSVGPRLCHDRPVGLVDYRPTTLLRG